jgi:hypothetical protein
MPEEALSWEKKLVFRRRKRNLNQKQQFIPDI